MSIFDEAFTQTLQDILATLMKRGFELPLTFSLEAQNGSTCLGTYDATPGSGGLNASILHHEIVDGVFIFPVIIKFTDAKKQEATATISPEQTVEFN